MRWKCICSYRGTSFAGWQYQASASTVQNHIENSLSRIFDTKIRIHGCSRTDAGVHAIGQCFHFDAKWGHSKEKLIRAIHSILDKNIRIEKIIKVSERFHARFSATKKRYCYTLYLGRAHPHEEPYLWACRETNINLETMIKASQYLVGTHNFRAYSAVHAKDEDPNPIKTIESIDIKKIGKKIRITILGSGFLYKMVRSIVGTLFAVGRGRLDAEAIQIILNSKKRTNKVITAPSSGLCLEKIYYR